jgi:hypothetical protein
MPLEKRKKTRVSVDLPYKEHIHLKVACASQGIPIRQFIIESIEKSLRELEERLDEEAFDQGKKEIKKNGTISLEEMSKRIKSDDI